VSALNLKGIVFFAACARRLHASPRAPRRAASTWSVAR
jgi:hypothetical protein